MGAIFNKAELLSRFNVVKQAISANSPIQTFKMLRIDVNCNEYKLIASDGLMQITAKGRCDGDKVFSQCVDSKMFSVMLSAAKNEINIVFEDNKIKTSSGKSKFNIPATDGSMFPILTLNGEYNNLNLKEVIDTTYKVIPAKYKNPAFCGLCLEAIDGTLNAIATDGITLLLNTLKIDFDAFQVILPKDSAEFLANIDTDGFCINEKSLKAYSEQDNFEIITKLIDSQYPKWRGILSDAEKQIAVDFNDLSQSISTIAKIESAIRVDLIGNENNLNITMKDGNGVMIDSKIECAGDAIDWCVDPKRFAVCLDYIGGDEITISSTVRGGLQSIKDGKRFILAMTKR